MDLSDNERHAWQRAEERLVGSGIDPLPYLRLAKAVALANRGRDVAMRVAWGLPAMGDCSGDVHGRASNGDTIWVIARHGRLATVMFRRGDQPSVKEAFGTDAALLRPKA